MDILAIASNTEVDATVDQRDILLQRTRKSAISRLYQGTGIAIIGRLRADVVGGKESPPSERLRDGCEEEERQDSVQSETISRQSGRRKNDSQISQGSSCFLTGTSRGRGFLRPARQDQAHRRFRARQGSGGGNPGARSLFWRRMSQRPSAAHRNNQGNR